MAGLLDLFDDPNNVGLLSAAANMLAASGPSRTPTSFGQVMGTGLMGGMQAYGAAKKQKLDQDKEQMQMDLLKQQVAQATRKNGLINDMLAQYSGSGVNPNAQAALAEGAAVGDIGPTVTNAARMDAMPQPQQPGMVNGIPRQAIAHDLAFNDGKNIAEWMFKRGTPDMQVANGYAYDKNNLQAGFLPGVTVSQNGQATVTMPDGRGGVRVGAPEGALPTYSAYRNADEAAKARFNLLPLEYEDGRGPIGGSQLEYLQSGARPAARSGLDLSKLTQQQIAYLQNKDPEAFANGVQDFMQTSGGGSLKSKAEKEAEIGKAGAENSAYEARLKDEQSRLSKDTRGYNQITAAIPMARDLLKKATGSGVGAAVDETLGFFGKSTEGGEAAKQLELISGWMTSNVPRMEGPQSNIDMLNYQTMAAQVGDRKQPVSVRMKALDTLEKLQNKYANLNGVQGAQEQPAPRVNLLTQLPTANKSNMGKMAIDHDTGKRYKSNGMQWIEVK